MPFQPIPGTDVTYTLIRFDDKGVERTDDPEGGVFSKALLKKVADEKPTDVFICQPWVRRGTSRPRSINTTAGSVRCGSSITIGSRWARPSNRCSSGSTGRAGHGARSRWRRRSARTGPRTPCSRRRSNISVAATTCGGR